MAESELERNLEAILEKVEALQEDVHKMRETLTVMQITDADARADAKVVAGELRVAAVALANTAQTIQSRDLARENQHAAQQAGPGAKKRPDFIGIALLVVVSILGFLALGKEGPGIIAELAKVFVH